VTTWFNSRKGEATGIMIGSFALGSALPHLVNALGGADWVAVMLVTSTMAVGGAIVALFVGVGPLAPRSARLSLATLPKIVRDRGVMLAIGAYLLHMFELYAYWSWVQTLFASRMSQPSASLVAFFAIGVGAPSCFVFGRVSDAIGRCYSTLICVVVSGVASLVIGHTLEWPALSIVVALILGFFVIADSAQYSLMVVELCRDKSIVGTALSLQMATGYALSSLTIFLVPLVRERAGIAWMLSVLSFGPLFGAILICYLRYSDLSLLLANGKR
jgi:hypothetical protein